MSGQVRVTHQRGGVRFAPIVDFFVCAGPGHSKQGCVLLARSLLFNTYRGPQMKMCLNRAMHFEYIHCRSVACSCSGLFISVVAQAHSVVAQAHDVKPIQVRPRHTSPKIGSDLAQPHGLSHSIRIGRQLDGSAYRGLAFVLTDGILARSATPAYHSRFRYADNRLVQPSGLAFVLRDGFIFRSASRLISCDSDMPIACWFSLVA